MSEHMCGKVWRKGTVKDCKRKGVHGLWNKPQGGWRLSSSTITNADRSDK